MIKYPLAKKIDHKKKHLNHEWVDSYSWLEDLEKNPEVRELIDEENKYFSDQYGEQQDTYQKILKELREKIVEEDTDVPEKIEHYYYYSRSIENKEYEVNCRKRDSLDSAEEIYFDENKWAEGHEFFELGSLEIDASHNKAVACIDYKGDEVYEAFYLDLLSKQSTPLKIDSMFSDIEWCNDSKVFYYLKLDESLRPYQCYRYKLEDHSSKLIYEENDPEYFVGLSSSKDEKYIFIESHGSITSEVHFLDANDPKALPRCFAKRVKGCEYYLGHHEESWVILSNHKVTNFGIYTCEKKQTTKESWAALLLGDSKKYISDYEVFKDFLVIYERENAQDRIRLYFWKDKKEQVIDQPEDCFHLGTGDNSNYDTKVFHYIYSSMTQSSQYIRYHTIEKTKEVLKTYSVPNHYKAEDYRSKRIFVEARDGKQIPVSILWAIKSPPEKAKAAYIYSYGAYGYSMDCGFDRKILSLLDRGVVLYQIHARGGADLGREWYEDGKFLNKKNTFFDVNDCAHFIQNENPNLKLIASGGSAGGLMVGACINLEPELYHLAILNVPFVDVVNTMLDDSQALTALEYDEWGNPNEEVFFKEILSYSPYDNIKASKYPICLSFAGLSDQRVKYWEALKYTQKLRENAQNPENVYLHTNTNSGHSGSSGRYEYLKEIALEYNFILKNI